MKASPKQNSVYTDSAKIKMHGHTGSGVYCQEFAHCIPIGAAFEGEVKAIEAALLNLIPRNTLN